MEFFEILLLAIIQGLTEFLPISSSGHLALFQNILEWFKGVASKNATLDILLHFGTLIATILFLRREIGHLLQGVFYINKKSAFQGHERKVIFLMILSLIPTALIGLFLEPIFEKMIDSTLLVGSMLLMTGLALYASQFFHVRRSKWDFGILIALAIGLAQGISIIPGLSRSGLTIVTALMLGVDRESAFKFSFLISIPAIFGATLLKIKELNFCDTNVMQGYIIGMMLTGIVGYLSLIILGRMIRTQKLYLFSYYCLTAGLLGLTLSLFGI